MTKRTEFSKKDNWTLFTYYQIYIKEETKTIKIIGATDRVSTDKNYLSWICIHCNEECEMPLEDFLLWDAYYQIDLLMSKDKVTEIEVSPEECYRQSNIWVKGDGEGSYLLRLTQLAEDTPCGFYYGY